MTHEELLDKIEDIEYWQEKYASKTFIKTLRAVVELHKNHGECGMPASDLVSPCPAINTCHECGTKVAYPCPTIQAIEKELQ